MSKKRLDYLDMVKGIGIILVVLAHSTFCNESVLTVITSFHMPLFFIVSGILLHYTKEEEKPFSRIILNKARTMLIPYITFSVVCLSINYYYVWKHPEIFGMDLIEKSFLQIGSLYGISVLWFLPALFLGELIFLLIRKHFSKVLTAIICLLLGVASIYLYPIINQEFVVKQDSLTLFLGYVMIVVIRAALVQMFIAFGYFIKLLLKEKEKVCLIEVFIAIILFVSLIWLSLQNGRVDIHFMIFNQKIIYFYCALAGGMALILCCKNVAIYKFSLIRNPLQFLGKNSLIIMVTHLDALVLYFAIMYANWLNLYITRAKVYMLYLNITIAIIVMELILIYVLNHWLFFLIGKKKPKKQENK